MLLNVLTNVAKDTGLHPITQKATLLRHLNSAASDMHSLLDCNAIQREVTLVVRPDAIVSLPYFIGNLIGMRRVTNDTLVDLHGIGFPRYVRNTINYRLNGWRLLGNSAIQTFPTSGASLLTLTCPIIENAEILICGNTSQAASFEETITMDSTIKVTDTLFGRDITKIASTTDRTADILISDASNVALATLHNHQQQTEYKLVDVSEWYWSVDTSLNETLVDVWYKLAEHKLVKDTDSFYAGDEYDNAWYFMALHYFYAGQADKVNESRVYRAYAINAMRLVKSNTDGKIDKRMTFGPNKYLEALQPDWYSSPIWK